MTPFWSNVIKFYVAVIQSKKKKRMQNNPQLYVEMYPPLVTTATLPMNIHPPNTRNSLPLETPDVPKYKGASKLLEFFKNMQLQIRN